MVAKNGTATRNRTAETARASAIGEVGQEEVDSPLKGVCDIRSHQRLQVTRCSIITVVSGNCLFYLCRADEMSCDC